MVFFRRDRISDWHKVPPQNRFSHWEELKGTTKYIDNEKN